MIDGLKQRMRVKSAALLLSIETGLDRIVIGWLIIAMMASALRLLVSPFKGQMQPGELLPYVLLVLAPAASMVLALRWFADGHRMPQPGFRLAQVGKWLNLPRSEAIRHPLFGAGGIMVSLLIGMLLNVPVRAAEYFAAMPPIPATAPQWLSTLHFAMTIDVVLFTSLYVIAFVAALRHVPLFPRFLVAIWMADLAMQLATAEMVARAPGLPATVATPLQNLLEGNTKKVLISIAVWLPYLLLSARVNVTYRSRVPA